MGRHTKHHSHISRRSSGSRGRKDEGDDGDDLRNDNVQVPLACTIRVPGVEERRADCEHIRWCGEAQTLDVSVSECLDDGREEIRDRACCDNTEEHDFVLLSVYAPLLSCEWTYP